MTAKNPLKIAARFSAEAMNSLFEIFILHPDKTAAIANGLSTAFIIMDDEKIEQPVYSS